jgi:hypothetical protein
MGRKRAKVEYETADYADMLERLIRRYGRRVADGDDLDLARMVSLVTAMDEALHTAVHGQRERFSWDFIARALGVTRSAAYQRFGRR